MGSIQPHSMPIAWTFPCRWFRQISAGRKGEAPTKAAGLGCKRDGVQEWVIPVISSSCSFNVDLLWLGSCWRSDFRWNPVFGAMILFAGQIMPRLDCLVSSIQNSVALNLEQPARAYKDVIQLSFRDNEITHSKTYICFLPRVGNWQFRVISCFRAAFLE